VQALLDAHAILWWGDDDSRLSGPARRVLADGTSQLFVSVASIWEIAIKSQKGDLTLPADVEAFIEDRLHRNRWVPLSVDQRHVIRAAALPMIHRDPFDRMLVAQSQIEDMPIITVDPAITRYDVETIW
jgi:PIN domain nuclease of toxin-antitoxin system